MRGSFHERETQILQERLINNLPPNDKKSNEETDNPLIFDISSDVIVILLYYDKELFAFKFCSADAYKRYCEMNPDVPTSNENADQSNSQDATLEQGPTCPVSPERA